MAERSSSSTSPEFAAAKVIAPHRCVDQNQAGFSERLRGAAFNAGCVPPNHARRSALSLSMSAFNPSRKTAVRSFGPASLVALSSNASSTLTFLRMFSPSRVGAECSNT